MLNARINYELKEMAYVDLIDIDLKNGENFAKN
jgi:hypothetical protein